MSHGRDHVERVLKLAVYIAEREGADVEVVKKSAELHDIARDKPNHAIESAKVAREILRREGYDEDFIEKVVHCIESHSFSSGIKPKTLEETLKHFEEKLLKLKDTLYTETAKKLAEDRHRFMVEFYERIRRELYEDC